MPAVGRVQLSNLRPAERGYFIDWDTIWEHLLSACILDRGSPFVAASAVFVNIEREPVVANEPDSRRSPLVYLQGVLKCLHRLEHGQQIAVGLASRPTPAVVLRSSGACWKEINTWSKRGTMAYRINSVRRLSSPMSPGGTIKIISSAAMRDRRCLIVSLV